MGDDHQPHVVSPEYEYRAQDHPHKPGAEHTADALVSVSQPKDHGSNEDAEDDAIQVVLEPAGDLRDHEPAEDGFFQHGRQELADQEEQEQLSPIPLAFAQCRIVQGCVCPALKQGFQQQGGEEIYPRRKGECQKQRHAPITGRGEPQNGRLVVGDPQGGNDDRNGEEYADPRRFTQTGVDQYQRNEGDRHNR